MSLFYMKPLIHAFCNFDDQFISFSIQLFHFLLFFVSLLFSSFFVVVGTLSCAFPQTSIFNAFNLFSGCSSFFFRRMFDFAYF